MRPTPGGATAATAITGEWTLVELVELLCECHRPQGPELSNGFPGQGVLPTPEGATGATSIAGMQVEHTSERRYVGVRISSMAIRTP